MKLINGFQLGSCDLNQERGCSDEVEGGLKTGEETGEVDGVKRCAEVYWDVE